MLSPIEFGPAPFELPLPPLDIELIGRVALTVWQLANQYSILVVFFFMVLGVGLIGWMYSLVTHRKSADLATFDVGDYIEDFSYDYARGRGLNESLSGVYAEVQRERYSSIWDD
jgi:hypothetical protein